MDERCNAIYQHISNAIEGMYEIAVAALQKDFISEGLSDDLVKLIHEVQLINDEMFYLDERRHNPKF